jgi:hypothetical protein
MDFYRLRYVIDLARAVRKGCPAQTFDGKPQFLTGFLVDNEGSRAGIDHGVYHDNADFLFKSIDASKGSSIILRFLAHDRGVLVAVSTSTMRLLFERVRFR